MCCPVKKNFPVTDYQLKETFKKSITWVNESLKKSINKGCKNTSLAKNY